MADYNSPYTGAEIDAGIAKTSEIIQFKQVYAGAPTTTGILLSSVPLNPGTGDRSGVYDILFTQTATPLDTTTENVFLSRLKIANEGASAIGTSHVSVNADRINTQNASYWKDGDGTFNAAQDTYVFADDSTLLTAWYIHEIYRLEKIQ